MSVAYSCLCAPGAARVFLQAASFAALLCVSLPTGGAAADRPEGPVVSVAKPAVDGINGKVGLAAGASKGLD